jgi:hypothetical protein
MPGLLGSIARTAVVAGTASAVSGRVQRNQAERFAQRDAQIYADREAAYNQAASNQAPPPPASPPPPAPAAGDDMITKLERLGDLKASGVLTQEEFDAQKAKILAG